MYEIIARCAYYTEPNGGFRDYIPEGTVVDVIGSSTINGVEWYQISGQDVNPWKRKWFVSSYARKIDTSPPTQPPPVVDVNDVMEHTISGVHQATYYRKVE